MALEEVSRNKAFGGDLIKYKFKSTSLGGLDANFNIFLPEQSSKGKVPLLVYLAGLTCNEDNGPQKGGFLGPAAKHGLALLFPDTSPRGAKIEGEDDDWDFGSAAGFYLNATSEKWSKHYNMLEYVTVELPKVIQDAKIPVDFSNASIFGHSMGGHGALTLYLSGLSSVRYKSASAFAPAANPTKAPWGEKAFKGYLKGGVEEGKKYDATELISQTKGGAVHILADIGSDDQFLHQLGQEAFTKAARDAGFSEKDVNVRTQQGYNHSYFFISTFAEEHIDFHASFLKA